MNYPSGGAPGAGGGMAGEPVVVCMGRALVAFDQTNGSVFWHFVAEAAIQRLFRVGNRILAACGESVVCVDVANGRHVGTVAIGFTPDAGLVCGTDLILADGTTSGPEAPRVICISSDGSIRWRATTATETQQVAGGWGGGPPGKGPAENVLRTYTPDGVKRSEIRYARLGYRAGILYAASVAQPDRS
jgi:hypothetical protein